jgi:diguanylate cyclase (GGDEF)-like protein
MLVNSKRSLVVIALPVLLIAAAVFGTARIERQAAIHAGDQQHGAQELLTAMLDQETGARGYFETGDARFLEPWYRGSGDFERGVANARRLIGNDAKLRAVLDQQVSQAMTWHANAQAAISTFQASGLRPTIPASIARKKLMDGFRAESASFAKALHAKRDARLTAASNLAVAVVVGLSILLTIGGVLIARGMARREARRGASQDELRELLQVSESEPESRMLLVRHIEKTFPGAAAAVMNRNNSDDRLEPTLGERARKTVLGRLEREQLRPRSCMAVRLSRPYVQQPADRPLMPCEVCGDVPGSVACEPLLVGGKVIGSVLVARERAFIKQQRDQLHEAVAQVAPILANQRNLALAETRAASDTLTGLPNRRSADEALKRMLAHGGRTLTPLALVLLDLDRFEHINDTYGHERGDLVLAMVGAVLRSVLRASDFAARFGGEEFIILLPDTDRSGALILAEKLRTAIANAEVAGVGSVSASLGVAVMPDDAGDPEQLLRKADRALYVAKSGGRNRVETVVPVYGVVPLDDSSAESV